MLDRLNETIVAVASPPGNAPLGIVRLSGPRAIPCADAVARLPRGRRLSDLPGSRRAVGKWMVDHDASLPAAFYLFRAPHSYTREDIVELHTLGNPVLLDRLRARLATAGAIDALPGEFTARAFLNGAMNLSQAEAVAALLRARTDAQLRAARRVQEGRLAREVTAIRDDIADMLALIEAGIDFVEEPVEFLPAADAARRLQAAHHRLNAWIADGLVAESLDVLPRILLLGAPNAGKSALLNRLSGTRRAICAAVAGTTRDILSAPIRLTRGEAILLDSAGLDATPDEVLAAARAAALHQAAHVDLIAVVLDLAAPDFIATWLRLRPFLAGSVVIAANKSDRLDDAACRARIRALRNAGGDSIVSVSALTGRGLETLRRAMTAALHAQEPSRPNDLLLTERQRNAVRDAADALDRARTLLKNRPDVHPVAELLAFELREALDALGAVNGAVTTDDLLAQVFARFCIGK